jgi:hypothetical protein
MDPSNKPNYINIISPFLENGTLHHIKIDGNPNKEKHLLIFKNGEITSNKEFLIKEEIHRVDKYYCQLKQNFLVFYNIKLEDVYSSITFICIFANWKEYRKLIGNLPSSNFHKHSYAMWYSYPYDNFVEDVENFLYPVSIKPAKCT